MSNFQEQSFDESAPILPLHESSPHFLHCEKERQAVEKLLSAGPEGFYGAIDTERCRCFLSPEEVRHMSIWAQGCHHNPYSVQQVESGEEGSSEGKDFHSTYNPCCSDVPAPSLELGWPEKTPWVQEESITVHTSPPAEGQPPVREIIRRHLQNACQVIAVVTDSLTDGPIIGDLHNAASRGVAVYIILNQRSVQENFTLNRLKHPNMRVRVLGGKTFCSRTGKKVVGELKDKFLLVDVETVIHGSYSLTWTDAHLHRQLITVLRGSAVDLFDREFRVLFAASLPVSATWRVADVHVERSEQLKDFSDLQFEKRLSLGPAISNPPSPPAESCLDWDAMGVCQFLPDTSEDEPLQNFPLFDQNTHIMNEDHILGMKRVHENTSPPRNAVLDTSSSDNPLPSETDLMISSRIKRRLNIKLDKAISRELFIERSTGLDDGTTPDVVRRSSYRRSNINIMEEENLTEEIIPKVETKSFRKPAILRLTRDINDIITRLQSPWHSRGTIANMSERSQSMMDLSTFNTDLNPNEMGVPAWRLKATGVDLAHVTPAFTLMQKRNNGNKPALQRTPMTFMFPERPHRFSFSKRQNREKEEEEEGREGAAE